MYPIASLEATVIEPSTVKLRWKPARRDGNKLTYIVEMQPILFPVWRTVAKEVAGTSYMISNLEPKQDYNFRVLVRSHFGDVSEPSPTASICRNFNASENNLKSSKSESFITKTKTKELIQEEVSFSTLMCEACQSNTTYDKLVQCYDGHLNCNTCVEKIVKKVLSYGNDETNIRCGYQNCNCYIPESQAKKVLPSLVIDLLEDKKNKQATDTISKMTDLYSCPFCEFKVLIDGDLKIFHCPQCEKIICRYCGSILDGDKGHTECTFNSFLVSMDLTFTLSKIPDGHKDFVAVQLGQNSQTEYNFVLTLFNKSHTMPVSRIFRIHNPRMWETYSLAKHHMIKDIGKENINEQHLFRGTANKTVGDICREGMDWRMCGENGTAFGQGTYFAKDSSRSLIFCYLCDLKGGVKNITELLSIMQRLNLNLDTLLKFNLNQTPTSTGSKFGRDQSTNSPHQTSGFCFGQSQTRSTLELSTDHNRKTSVGFDGLNTSTKNDTPHKSVFNFGANPSHSSVPNVTRYGLPLSGARNSSTAIPEHQQSAAENLLNSGTLECNMNRNNEVGILSQACDQSGSAAYSPMEEQFIDNRNRYMFLARVLVGRSCQGVRGMRRPARDSQNRLYNSACDNPAKPSEIVIFDRAQCYPEYVIEFA